MTDEEAPPDFEHALSELEALVERMENGDLSLEESLQSFERGIRLTKACQQALKHAEQRVDQVLSDDPDAEAEPLDRDR